MTPRTPQEVRRALARAGRGAAPDLAEATALLSATGEQLDALCAVAARVRDAGLVAPGRAGVVTYSPKVFVPVTRSCSSSAKTVAELEDIGTGIDRPVVERTTTYRVPTRPVTASQI